MEYTIIVETDESPSAEYDTKEYWNEMENIIENAVFRGNWNWGKDEKKE